MKKVKCTKSCLLLSMALLLGNTAFTAQAKAETVTAASTGRGQGVTVENVTLHTYAGDDGQEVESITYLLKDIKELGSIAPEDFRITVGSDSYKVNDIKIMGNNVKLYVDAFRYLGKTVYNEKMQSTHYDFAVDSTVDVLDLKKGDSCLVKTRTADDFEKGTFTGSNGIELPYWLYMPAGTSKVPLMLWEHGGGEVLATSFEGANILNNRGAVSWIEDGYQTAVLSFQFPENYSFGISDKPDQLKMMQDYNVVIYEFIQDLINKGKIDSRRVYISGASSGGGAVLRFVMQYPDFFAAALPICAKDTLIPISQTYGLAYKFNGSLALNDQDYQKCYRDISDLMSHYNITGVPIWFVQAENDPVCTSYTSKILYEVLKDQGAKNNKITMYGDEEMKQAGQMIYHSSWVPAFRSREIMDWVYSQKKQ
nr:prolyl oligopeptidase family serine peptidase [uncultured Clostridium sp.]